MAECAWCQINHQGNAIHRVRPARYSVTTRTAQRNACGLHLAAVVAYMTPPGRTATVEPLPW